MKKVKTVTVKPVEPTTREVTTYYCDVTGCKDKAQMRYSGNDPVKCEICKRDICKRHMNHDPDEMGDYPSKWCSICYGLYLIPRRDMNERHWKEEDELLEKVRKESLSK